jgi:hypothetical protein
MFLPLPVFAVLLVILHVTAEKTQPPREYFVPNSQLFVL